jgi:hypothetical protein
MVQGVKGRKMEKGRVRGCRGLESKLMGSRLMGSRSRVHRGTSGLRGRKLERNWGKCWKRPKRCVRSLEES